MLKKYNRPDTRQLIIELAEELFAKQGYDGTSTRQIAAGVGIASQTFHHHIKSKANLYNIVLEKAMSPVTYMINWKTKGVAKPKGYHVLKLE